MSETTHTVPVCGAFPCRPPQGVGRIAKEIMDRAGAAVGLVLLAPVVAVIAWHVRKDGGPVIYRHPRIGKDGRPFKCWKFRSMVMGAEDVLKEIFEKDPAAREEYARTYKLKDDPRITRIGRFLRKTSLDEIPQLVNVLKGEMSLVGPRPIVEDEKKYYGDKISCYLAVKPGVTGLWQVTGRSDTSYEYRVALDYAYVTGWSFWKDIVILFKTVYVVLHGRGAY